MNSVRKPAKRLRYRVMLPTALLLALGAAIVNYFAADRATIADLEARGGGWLFVVGVFFAAYSILFIPGMALVTFQMNKALRRAGYLSGDENQKRNP